MSLDFKHVSVSLGKKKILSDVSFSVQPGTVHALMGPNGAGKSTLALAAAGHPDYVLGKKSSILLDGTELADLSPDERSQNGLFLAFQYPVEVPGVKVQSFLRQAYNARFADNPEKLFDKVIQFRDHLYSLAEELSVSTDLLTRGLNEGFSGGEKKRLEVLQMALLEPRYAILDETDSGLDIDAIKAVAGGISTVQKKHNTGIIIITHYQRILDYVQPDVVHVLKNGALVETGGREIVERLERRGMKGEGQHVSLTKNCKLLQKAALFHTEKVLLLRRSNNEKSRPGCWDLPGGNSEWPEDATANLRNMHLGDIVREIQEETGLVFDRELFTLDKISLLFTFFEVEQQQYSIVLGWRLELDHHKQPSIAISHEHTEYAWVSPQDLDKYDFGGERGNWLKKWCEDELTQMD